MKLVSSEDETLEKMQASLFHSLEFNRRSIVVHLAPVVSETTIIPDRD